tara:strand:+ start:1227 stop:1622 length:396 start_codon:yes stop_codon:yes gene_type:complete
MATLRERIRAKGELLLAHQPILTLGCTVVTSLSLATLATATVLSTASQTSSTANNTSVANTFTNYESLEVKIGELEVRATGKNITEALTNLMQNALEWEIMPFSEERYYPSILLKEKLTLKRPNNSSYIMY